MLNFNKNVNSWCGIKRIVIRVRANPGKERVEREREGGRESV